MRTDNKTTTTLNLNKGFIFMDNSLIAEISRKFLIQIYEKMLLSLLTPSIEFALNKHFFFIIIDTGKNPGMENSGWEKSSRGKFRGEKSGGKKSGRGKVRRGKFCLRFYQKSEVQ